MFNTLQWLVISGGPGMSNNYLKYALPKAFLGYNLHFYDAYGSPESGKKMLILRSWLNKSKKKYLILKPQTMV